MNATTTGNKRETLSVPATANRDGFQYRCRITNSSGSVYSDAVTLTVVLKEPEITIQPIEVVTAEGNTARFSVTANGSGLTYQWQYRKNGDNAWTNALTTGNKKKTLSVPATAGRDGYQYRCMVANKSGVVYSDPATLKVILAKPSIVSQPESITVAEGKLAHFTVDVKGSKIRYQWQYRKNNSEDWENALTTGNKLKTLSVPATAGRNNLQYRCIVSNNSGTVISDAAVLTVTLSKPAIVNQPKDVYVTVGDTAEFTVLARGSGLTYQWQYRKSGTGNWTKAQATGNKEKTLLVSSTLGRDGYQYRCLISNSSGTVFSEPATLKVGLNIPVITTQPIDVTATEGDTAQFVVAVNGFRLTYQWQYRKSDVGEWANATAPGNKQKLLTVPVTLNRNGYQYRCVISNDAGSVYSDVVTLTVNLNAPSITTQPTDSTVAEGDTVRFSVVVSGSELSYQWQYRKSDLDEWVDATATGNKQRTIVVSATRWRNGYQYRCIITNGSGTVFSEPATLNVNSKNTINSEALETDVTALLSEEEMYWNDDAINNDEMEKEESSMQTNMEAETESTETKEYNANDTEE